MPEVLNDSGVLLSIELPGTPQQVIDAVQSLGLEGVIANRRTSRYSPGDRNTSWVKLNLDRQQEFSVGGYRPGPHGVDALLVGYYDGKDLRFAGKSEPALHRTCGEKCSRKSRRCTHPVAHSLIFRTARLHIGALGLHLSK